MQRLLEMFCRHRETIIKTNGTRMYVACLRCGHTSDGIVTGGHIYSGEALRERIGKVQRLCAA